MEKPLPVPPFLFPASAVPRRPMGYDRDVTHNVFASLASSYEQVWLERDRLTARVAELEAELEQLRGEVEEMRKDEPVLRDAFVAAHRAAKATIEEAQREAEAIVAQARAEWDAALAEEKARAEEELETIRRVARSTEHELSAFLRDAIERVQLNEGAGDSDAEAEVRSA